MASTHSTSFSASETSITRSQEGGHLIEIRSTVCYTTELSSAPLGDNDNSRNRSKSLQGSYALEKERHTANTAVSQELHPHLQSDSPRSAVSAPPSLSYVPSAGHQATRLHSNAPKSTSPSPPPWPRRRILFYHKHEPHYGFTNFSPHSVYYNEKSYPTSEHLFQSFKFSHRPNLAEHIRTCDPRPSKAFSEARRFQPEVRPDWKQVNIPMMDVVLWHKFNQHQDLKDELLSTGNAELIENSDQDAFWGIGNDGKGKNELGKALQRLRTRLRIQAQTTQ